LKLIRQEVANTGSSLARDCRPAQGNLLTPLTTRCRRLLADLLDNLVVLVEKDLGADFQFECEFSIALTTEP